MPLLLQEIVASHYIRYFDTGYLADADVRQFFVLSENLHVLYNNCSNTQTVRMAVVVLLYSAEEVIGITGRGGLRLAALLLQRKRATPAGTELRRLQLDKDM